VHTHGSGSRRRGKPRSRILYWFRTPPGVRIGRSALDEDAIRLIEQHNPDVDFDWTRILKGEDSPGGHTPGTEGQTFRSQEPRGAAQQNRRNRPRPEDYPAGRRAESPAVRITHGAPEAVDAPEVVAPMDQGEPVAQAIDTPQDVDSIEPAVLAAVQEFLVEPRVEPPVLRPQAGDALSEVEARLGSEGLSRLRARYAEVLARISDAVSEPARQEELKATAERLNPDTWVTEAEVRAGLEDYEMVFESLRMVVGRRRKRRRRSGERQGSDESGRSQSGSSAAQDEQSLNQAEPDTEDEPGSGGHQ